MDEWIKQSLTDMAGTTSVDATSLVVSLLLAFVLSAVLAWLYVRTHEGYSYSRSFVQTIVFVSITFDLIMIIIGSNIARAFALVGAMSIVRFRNPIKDSRDLVFLFMAMAIGMATGTQFYFLAVIFTIFASIILVGFHRFGFGRPRHQTMVVRVRLPEARMPELRRACERLCKAVSIIAIDRSGDAGGFQDVILELELARGQSDAGLIESLVGIAEGISVNVLVGESSVSV